MALDFAESMHIRGANGGTVEVDDGRLRVNIKTEFDIAVENGLAFAWAGLDEDQDAGDTLLALENNSSTHMLCIERIFISVTTVGGGSVCPVFTASGITVAGTTAVIGYNLNRTSGRTSVGMATCFTEETGNTEAGTWAGKVYMPQVIDSTPYGIHVGGRIRLPNDHMIGIDSIEEPNPSEAVTIIGYFVPI